MNKKLFKRRLWEGLTVGSASLLVISCGGYEIANAQRSAINSALNVSTSDITRSDDPKFEYFKSDFKNKDYSEVQTYFQNVSEKAEAEGVVLLKNDNALPLANGTKITTMLSGSNHFGYASTGSSASNGGTYTSLKDALTNEGLSVNETMWNYYDLANSREKLGSIYYINESGYDEIDDDAIASIDEYSTVICTISRSSGEGSDLNAKKSDGLDGSYLSLSEGELSVLQNLKTLKDAGKVSKVIVLLNTSSTVQLDFLSRADVAVDACLWVGNVGTSGIKSVAKILTGEINPSGKLSDTYVKNSFASPAAAQLKYAGNNYSFAQTLASDDGLLDTQRYYGIYNEGIYVGYRYFETRYFDYVTDRSGVGEFTYSNDVAYPFGYGLGYATFAYSNFNVEKTESGFTVTVKVTNTSTDRKGKESALIYVQKPYTQYDINNGVEKASVELVGYDKTEELAPGASETLTIKIAKEQLKSYDANKAKTYIEEVGDYYFAIGNGSHEACNNILAAKGVTPESSSGRMDAAGDATLAKKIEIEQADIGDYAVNPENNVDKLAKSVHTGKEITNKFNDADINQFLGQDVVTYVSRNNWSTTMPSATVALTADTKMREGLTSNRAFQETSGLSIPKYEKSNGLTTIQLRGKDFDDPEWDDLLDQMSYADQTNLIVNGQLQTVLVGSVGKPDTKEDDGPTGVAHSKAGLSLPSEGIWASSFNNDLLEQVGDALAEEAIANGYQGMYANGVNIHRTPFGGRTHEYFSEDPFLSGIAGASEVKGMQNKGVIAHVKHLAFNDQEAQRNGISVWLNEQGAREIYLAPFEYTLSPEYGNGHAVMSSFNRVGTTWAGAHKGLFDVVRNEFGFDGYSITDMASSNGAAYMTYQDGLLAGTDLWLGSGTEKALDKYKDSPTIANAMRDASHRLLYTIANYSVVMNGISNESTFAGKTPWWQSLIIGLTVTSSILTAGCASLWAMSIYLENKEN